MACRGVFFSITPEQAASLRAATYDDDVMKLVEDIEEAWDKDNLAQCDKSWDALHRLLTDGELQYGNGPEPLRHCVLGPEQLYEDDDYIVSLVEPAKVAEVSRALDAIDKDEFDRRYETLVPPDYGFEHGDEDRDYTWHWFQGVRDLYRKAAKRRRFMLFTVDQ